MRHDQQWFRAGVRFDSLNDFPCPGDGVFIGFTAGRAESPFVRRPCSPLTGKFLVQFRQGIAFKIAERDFSQSGEWFQREVQFGAYDLSRFHGPPQGADQRGPNPEWRQCSGDVAGVFPALIGQGGIPPALEPLVAVELGLSVPNEINGFHHALIEIKTGSIPEKDRA